jgi:hypothetical protein
MARQHLLLLLGLTSSACHDEAVRTYRVAFSVAALPGDPAARTVLPDTCYEPQGLPGATAPEQIAAEGFCKVGKRPSSGGMTATNIVTQEDWTLFGDGAEKEYLVRRTNPTGDGTELGIVGRKSGNTLVFASTQTTFGSQCPGQPDDDAGFFNPQEPLIGVCDGKCVNLNADPAHCGRCGGQCPNGFTCAFGRCQPTCGGGFFTTCNGVSVDTSFDQNNCGQCDNPCPPGTVCAPSFGFSGPGRCVGPCEALCTGTSLSEGCGAPAEITKEVSTLIEATLSGDVISATLTQGIAFTCLDGGCAVDFGSRCPSCAVAVPVSGRELSKAVDTQTSR